MPAHPGGLEPQRTSICVARGWYVLLAISIDDKTQLSWEIGSEMERSPLHTIVFDISKSREQMA
jgi:hypothetical protein